MNYTIPQSQLQPNFAEIELVTDEINIYVTQYSSDLFKECISGKYSGYFFYRDGDQIFALPEKENLSRPIGFNQTSISSYEVPYVFSKLIHIAFKILFESLGREVYRKKYSSLSIFKIASEDAHKIGDLELVPKCEYSIVPVIKNSKVIFIITMRPLRDEYAQGACY